MGGYSRERLLGLIGEYENKYGKLPSTREIRKEYRMCESHFKRCFGGLPAAKEVYLREYGSQQEADLTETGNSLLDELASRLSTHELKILVKASRQMPPVARVVPPRIEATGYFKALVCSDTHIGHEKFNEDWWWAMVEHAEESGCMWGWHVGDILEGMSGRPGHVYELSDIGFERQFEKARGLLEGSPLPFRAITGNHDNWYCDKGDQGMSVGLRLAEALPDKFIYLGNGEADEDISGIKVKLWHGNDGGTKILSYRGQTFVDSLTGGEKPHILLTGHDHKSYSFQYRNVQVIGAGTLSAQSKFMRGKKLQAHPGYWIIEAWACENGLLRIRPEWNPFF